MKKTMLLLLSISLTILLSGCTNPLEQPKVQPPTVNSKTLQECDVLRVNFCQQKCENNSSTFLNAVYTDSSNIISCECKNDANKSFTISGLEFKCNGGDTNA
jgi:hypothetical protein